MFLLAPQLYQAQAVSRLHQGGSSGKIGAVRVGPDAPITV